MRTMLNKTCQKTSTYSPIQPPFFQPAHLKPSSPKNFLSSTTNKINKLNFPRHELHQKKISEHHLPYPRPLHKYQQLQQQEDGVESQKALTLPEKLAQIETVINQYMELTSIYGYFYVTKAMITFEKDGRGVNCWIHPKKKSQKPLHPIIKKQHKEKQKEFYKNLKLVLKQLYPEIGILEGTTYLELIVHVNQLKKIYKRRLQRKNSFQKLAQTAETLARVKSEELILREKQKTLNKLITQPSKFEGEGKKSQRYRKMKEESHKNSLEYQKNTMSTLLGSIKSNASIKDNIQEKVPIFQREYEGKKSVIVQNRRQDSSSQGLSSDFDELFSDEEKEDGQKLRESVAKEFESLLLD